MEQPLRDRQSFPAHHLEVDANGEQFVTYTTLRSGETVHQIAKKFGMTTEQLVDANSTRHPGMHKLARLEKGTALVFDAPDDLLVCSKCKSDEDKDELLICDGACTRAYHLTCANLRAIPDGDYFCVECIRNGATTGNTAGAGPSSAPSQLRHKRPRRDEPAGAPEAPASQFQLGHKQQGCDGSLWQVEGEWEGRKLDARSMVKTQGTFVHFWEKCGQVSR